MGADGQGDPAERGQLGGVVVGGGRAVGPVGGARGDGGQSFQLDRAEQVPAARRPATASPRVVPPRTTSARTYVGAGKNGKETRVRPEDVIPLGEGGLKDF